MSERDDLDEMLDEIAADPDTQAAYEDALLREESGNKTGTDSVTQSEGNKMSENRGRYLSELRRSGAAGPHDHVMSRSRLRRIAIEEQEDDGEEDE